MSHVISNITFVPIENEGSCQPQAFVSFTLDEDLELSGFIIGQWRHGSIDPTDYVLTYPGNTVRKNKVAVIRPKTIQLKEQIKLEIARAFIKYLSANPVLAR